MEQYPAPRTPMTGPEHWKLASKLVAEAGHPQRLPHQATIRTQLADVHARLAVGALLGEALYEELPPAWAEVLR